MPKKGKESLPPIKWYKLMNFIIFILNINYFICNVKLSSPPRWVYNSLSTVWTYDSPWYHSFPCLFQVLLRFLPLCLNFIRFFLWRVPFFSTVVLVWNISAIILLSRNWSRWKLVINVSRRSGDFRNIFFFYFLREILWIFWLAMSLFFIMSNDPRWLY